MKDTWRPVKGYEDGYIINQIGTVISLNYRNTGKPKKLAASDNGSGYLMICPSKNGTSTPELIHRLVANTFIPNPNNLPQVNHIDEDKLNNSVNNLEWVTRSQNLKHGTARSRMVEKQSKPVVAKDLNGEVILEFSSLNEAGRIGYDPSNISKCCRGIRASYKGLKWEYLNSREAK